MEEHLKIVEECSKSGHRILKVNSYYLHSKYDPIKEAKKFANSHFKKNFLHILFGLGAGYIAEALYEKMTEDEFLIIVEPFEQIVDGQNENIQQFERTLLFKGQNKVHFKQIIEPFVKKFGKRICFIGSPNYENIADTYYRDILQIVKDFIYMEQVNINTINFFSKDWQRNFTFNLFFAFNDYPLKILEDYFDVPVIVASGGPSLTKQIPLLKKIRKHVVLIASGSTINTLLNYHLEPDFVVTIDGTIRNYEHFERIKLKHGHMIYSLSNHNDIRKHYHRRAFIFNTNMEVQTYAKKLLDRDIDLLLGGGSVATYALSIANKITTGSIALIGQDLAYTDNKSHAEFNKNFKVINKEDQTKRGMFFTEGYNGDQVLTDYPFFLMKHNFEQLLKTFEHPERIYNCTEGGVKLEGYQQIPFEQFCKRFVNPKKFPPSLTEDIFSNRTIEEWKEFFARVKNEIGKHDKIERLSQEAVLLLKQNRSKTHFDPKILRKLEKIDEKLKPLFEEGMMSLIVQPIINETFHNYLPKEKESKQEFYERVFVRSLNLYLRLKAATTESKIYFKRLKRMIETKIKLLDNEG